VRIGQIQRHSLSIIDRKGKEPVVPTIEEQTNRVVLPLTMFF